MGSTVLANLGPEAVDSTDVCTAEDKRELLILTYFINKCVNQSLLTHRGATHERFDWSVLPLWHHHEEEEALRGKKCQSYHSPLLEGKTF